MILINQLINLILSITNCPNEADEPIEDKEGYLDLFVEDKFLFSVALIKGAVSLLQHCCGVVHFYKSKKI